MLISKTLPNLMNGVSQQPDALRFDTQCTAQENGYPSVVEGLSKRLPTEHVCKTNLTGDAPTFIHTINREGNEKYTVLIRDKSIRVYDLDGTEKTVEIGGGAGTSVDDVTYLDTSTPDTSIKAITIADVTFVTNTEKVTEMVGDTPTSINEHEALIFISQAYDSDYVVKVKQGDETITATVAGTNAPNANDIASGLAQALTNVETGSNAFYTGASSVQTDVPGTTSASASLLNAQGFQVASTQPITGCRVKSNSSYPDNYPATRYVWEIREDNSGSPTGTTVASAISTHPGAYQTQNITFSSPFTPQTNTLYWLVQRRQSYNAWVNGWTDRQIEKSWLHNSSGGYPTGGIFTATSYYNGAVQPGDYWFEIFQQQAAGSATTTVRAEASGPAIYLSSDAEFSITTTNTYSDSYIQSFKDKTQKFTELPLHAHDKMIMKVEGEPDAGVDDYYVKFVTNAEAGGVGEGVWEECSGPGIVNGLTPSPTTMPHLLIKQANGTFVFKPADSEPHTSSASGTPTYDYSKFAWGNRIVGDTITNPDPTFIGKTINNLFLFKNRLGVLSDENVIFSESGEYFNFFRFTVIDLLDTAVIDVASASSEVATLRHAIPVAEKLVILSDASQFVVQADTALSAKTVSIARATSYNIIPNTAPTAAENSIFFAFNRGSFSGVREYFPTGLEETFEGVDISTQVPKYIPSDITKIEAAKHENVLFAMSSGDTDSLYIYNYYNSDSKRVQSAWHRWEFGSGTKILNIDLVDTNLYLTMYRPEGVFIEKMAVEIGKTDTGSKYVSRLDRRFKQTDATVSNQTITMPYNKTPGRNIEVITADGERVLVAAQSDGSNQITVDKDMTGVSFYAGEAYEMSYTFSDIVLKEGTQTGGLAVMTDGRIQVRYGTVTFGDSGSFDITVTPDFRDSSLHPFTGRILGAGTMTLGSVPLESGEFRFPVFSKADQVSITIKNDTPLPSNFLSAEYELSWNPRSRRM